MKMPDEGYLPVGYPRGTYPVPSADLGNRPWSAVIFLLLRADKKVGGEPQNRGGNYLKRIILLVWPYKTLPTVRCDYNDVH